MSNLQTIVTNYKKEQDDFEKNILLAEIITEAENTIRYYCIKYRNLPIDKDDIRAELLMELIKALEKYELNVGCEFKTFFSQYCVKRMNKLHRDLGRQMRSEHNEEGEILYTLSYDNILENGYEGKPFTEGSYNTYEDVEVRLLLESLPLEDMERSICEKLALGYKPKEIATSLGLSPSMVTYMVKKIREKFKTNLVFC